MTCQAASSRKLSFVALLLFLRTTYRELRLSRSAPRRRGLSWPRVAPVMCRLYEEEVELRRMWILSRVLSGKPLAR